jgi:hypothetical protein
MAAENTAMVVTVGAELEDSWFRGKLTHILYRLIVVYHVELAIYLRSIRWNPRESSDSTLTLIFTCMVYGIGMQIQEFCFEKQSSTPILRPFFILLLYARGLGPYLSNNS